MTESLINGLASQFSGDTISQLSGLLGSSQEDTGKAVAAALPMLLGSIAGNADQPQGVNALAGALTSGHDGSILDMLGPLLSGGYATRALGSDGSRILGHLLGDQQGSVESSVAQFAGVDSGLVQKLLPIIAPIVMGYIGKRVMSGGLDVGGLGSLLGQEREQAKSQEGGLGAIFDVLSGNGKPDAPAAQSGGGLMDIAGDLLGSGAGKAILGQILG